MTKFLDVEKFEHFWRLRKSADTAWSFAGGNVGDLLDRHFLIEFWLSQAEIESLIDASKDDYLPSVHELSDVLEKLEDPEDSCGSGDDVVFWVCGR